MISISISCEAEEIPAVRAILGGILQEKEKEQEPEKPKKEKEYLTQEQKEEIRRLASEGLSTHDIAQKLGIHGRRVWGVLNQGLARYQVESPQKAPNSPVAESTQKKTESPAKQPEKPAKPGRSRADERILALRAEKKSMTEIADILMREQGGPWTGADVLMRIEKMKAEAK